MPEVGPRLFPPTAHLAQTSCWLDLLGLPRRRATRRPAPTFEPAAAVIKKRVADEAGVAEGGHGKEDEAPTGISTKDKLMMKLLLLHEDNFRGSARDQNVVARLKRGSQMQLALEAGIQNYQRIGKEARSAVEPSEFRGHPLGKKPDVYLRMLLFRLSEATGTKYDGPRSRGPRIARR